MAARYLEIAAELRQRIETGEFPPGARLPGVGALAQQYGTGAGVIVEATAVLELEGRVVIRQRSGTFVVPNGAERHRVDLGRTVRRNELGYIFAAAAGHWPPISTPTREWTPAPAPVAERLGIEPGAEVLARYRVVGPDEPVQITTSYLLPDLARGTVLAEADTGPGGWIDRLEHDMGHGPLRWASEVTARLPTEAEADALGVSPRLPVLVLYRTHTDPDGRTVAVDVVVVEARQWSVRVPITRATSARWPTKPATGRNEPVTHGEGGRA